MTAPRLTCPPNVSRNDIRHSAFVLGQLMRFNGDLPPDLYDCIARSYQLLSNQPEALKAPPPTAS